VVSLVLIGIILLR